MDTINSLKYGQKLSTDEVTYIFKCTLQGGMNKSNKTNSLVLVFNHIKYSYNNRWDDDIIHYTGMGQKGDQSLDFRFNKTLNESNQNGVKLYLFEKFVAKEYTYRGKVKLNSEPYQEEQVDFDSNRRKVWMFPLKLIDFKRSYIEIDDINKIEAVKEKNIKKMSSAKIRSYAENFKSKDNVREVVSKHIDRNPHVKEYAKIRAAGVCQLCEKKAPFNTANGEPFLEVHHVDYLRNNGDDSWDNVVALCPNCHRKIHSLENKDDYNKLKKLAKIKI